MGVKRTFDLNYKDFLADDDQLHIEDTNLENFKVPGFELKRSDKIFFDSTDLNLDIPISDNVQELLKNMVTYFGDPNAETLFEDLDEPLVFDVGTTNDDTGKAPDYSTLKEALLDNAFKRYGTSIDGKLGQAVTLRVGFSLRNYKEPELVIDGLDLSHISIVYRDLSIPVHTFTSITPTVNDGEIYLFRFINGAKSPIFKQLSLGNVDLGVGFCLVDNSVFRSDRLNNINPTVTNNSDGGFIKLVNNSHFSGYFKFTSDCEFIIATDSSVNFKADYITSINGGVGDQYTMNKFLTGVNIKSFIDLSIDTADEAISGSTTHLMGYNSLNLEADSIFIDISKGSRVSVLSKYYDLNTVTSTMLGFYSFGQVHDYSSLSYSGYCFLNAPNGYPLVVDGKSSFSNDGFIRISSKGALIPSYSVISEGKLGLDYVDAPYVIEPGDEPVFLASQSSLGNINTLKSLVNAQPGYSIVGEFVKVDSTSFIGFDNSVNNLSLPDITYNQWDSNGLISVEF